MKNKYTVSIIIPVYNGEDMISKCMDSVVNQTYKNIEVILLNDGSLDNSLKIMRDYEKKYDYVKVINSKNVGISEIRNIGFKYVRGDYVCYLDVDDYLDSDFIEKMIEDNDNSDIIIGGYNRVDDDGNIIFSYVLKDSVWNKFRRTTIWAKLYKVSFLKKEKIHFPHDRVYSQDAVYTLWCMMRTKRVLFKNYIGYNNVVNENSITHKNRDQVLRDIPKLLDHINNVLKSNKRFVRDNKNIVYFYILKIFVGGLKSYSVTSDYKIIKEYYDTCFKKVKNIFKKYNINIHFCIQKYDSFRVNFSINMFILFERIHCMKFFLYMLNKVFYKKK